MARGDHIFVGMGMVDHHGIDIGNSTVVHRSSGMAGEKSVAGTSAHKRGSRILRTPITLFGDLKHHLRCLSRTVFQQ